MGVRRKHEEDHGVAKTEADDMKPAIRQLEMELRPRRHIKRILAPLGPHKVLH